MSMVRGPNRSVRPPVSAVSSTGGPDQHRAVSEMPAGLAPKWYAANPHRTRAAAQLQTQPADWPTSRRAKRGSRSDGRTGCTEDLHAKLRRMNAAAATSSGAKIQAQSNRADDAAAWMALIIIAL